MTQHAWSKVTVLAMTFVIGAALACRAENLAVRNCTWSHGGAAQGYTPAPRLAGQRYLYLENQLADFHAHTRDNPLSRHYMWGAAANLAPQSVRNLSMYFATLLPQAADDGDRELVATGPRGTPPMGGGLSLLKFSASAAIIPGFNAWATLNIILLARRCSTKARS